MAAMPGQVLQPVGGEDVVDVAHLAHGAQLVAVGRDDARRLLPAVLKRVQAEVREICRFRVSVDSNDPAHRAGRLAHSHRTAGNLSLRVDITVSTYAAMPGIKIPTPRICR